jgi:D-alanyl-D-alanine dipeptidase
MKYFTSIIIITLLSYLIIKYTSKISIISKKISPEYDSSDFVDITTIIPDIILEIRYYSTYNFVGERINGYKEPISLMTKEAANALKKVNDYLKEKGYLIKIYDSYRPQRAVDHFVNWTKNNDTKMKKYFYPDIEKKDIIPKDYVASKSGHSKGSTIDLTLFDMNKGKEIDMGSTFDFFGEISHPNYTNITNEQKKNRQFLIDSMKLFNFEVIDTEWWHFYLKNQPFPNTYFDFEVSRESLKQNKESGNFWLYFFSYFGIFIIGFLVGLGIFYLKITKNKDEKLLN